jgi:uncharacterized membrane-anchored protein YhcB (DUF1043 family)
MGPAPANPTTRLQQDLMRWAVKLLKPSVGVAIGFVIWRFDV